MQIFKSLVVVAITACAVSLASLIGLAQNQNPAAGGAPQTRVQKLAERLGLPPDAKLLIVHADDIGLAHSVNAASLQAMATGVVNSGSVMVPCPWFPEIAAAAHQTPELDLGLHLTLTSEWKNYRWPSVLPRSEVASLHDARGFLYATSEEAAAHAKAQEAEREIRAQVARAKEFGLNPTHLDSHMGSLFQTKELFEAYLRVARDNKIPALVPREQLEQTAPGLMAVLNPDDILIDRVVIAPPTLASGEWERFYSDAIETLRPGVTEIIIHLATDDDEMRAVAIDHPAFGAAWRQRDFNFFTNPKVRQLLEKNGVRLITWREIGKLIRR